MPAFLADMVARGFWWAILASMIFACPFGILGWLLGKINKFIGVIIQYGPSTFFWFYIWQIRNAVGWLICAILMAVWLIIVIVGIIIQQKNG